MTGWQEKSRHALRWLRQKTGTGPAVWNGFPAADQVDRTRFARDLARPPAGTEYVMFFTARSGSSWVCDIVNRTRRLGVLGESFNPNFLPDMTRAMNVTDMDEYHAILRRRRNRGGVMGFQITHHQLIAVFGSEDAFLARFPARHAFWLIRQDIVLQAISLFKMQKTEITHAPRASPEEIRARDAGLVYDGDEIRHWLRHILAGELATEAMIERAGLAPLRMSYERNTEMKPNHLVNVMGRHMGLPTMRMKPLHSDHHKIATSRNSTFAERFRAENADFLDEVADLRAPMLEKLVYYGPKRAPDASGPKSDMGSDTGPGGG